MQITFVFDTEKDDAQTLINMLEEFIESSDVIGEAVVKELKSSIITTRKVDKRYRLSFDEVQEIRKACENGATLAELSRKYGVSPQNISLIKNNKTRLHY